MKEIIVGTRNKAKVEQIRGALAPLDIVVKGLSDDRQLPEVEEDGLTAQENARKKACVYAQALGKTVLSMDNALYFDKLSPEKQPGINVRRIPPALSRPGDEQMLKYYCALVKSLGKTVKAHWEFAVCVAEPKGKTHETVIFSPRIFVSLPSTTVIPGYPLESIQIDPVSDRYISEMSQKEQDQFWQIAIGNKLSQFVKTALH